ncbi:phosphoglycerate dehydrogenase [Acidomonas methanolica]|uniref:D-3-phosphoglycerate dehydrogenase n=1 Tax=Acidomonas methanolica NBRC 104435 TaxID=1231351 RepID=A0A023D4D1_ACIMT|nr:phosphoglycerate dehydrogenase [Acidomonas methanolica]MBU2653270.1 phosphoglycerate dehydrogenase [Acidomonas methanolica]MCQ9154511.1 phosphoglycerate dehydrogenase [Acidomonas methanolica]TCS32219.1 D-3-phosphoglycerate dehydrogenase [Acidomonas methanolica]GAJ29023.1 D-3-phosphoglycerate dehydrogenase [Acidomonas methanolica NBRC 104435]GBQ52393.1 D-3-phosphoglycerate dehydrogenase [Acidomonas methanolica]
MDVTLSLPKDKIRILLLEGIHESAVAYLNAQGYGQITRLKTALEGDALREALNGVHMVGIRSRTQLTAPVIEAADRLMAIGCFCIGTNQVDLKAARIAGIPVFNAPFSNTRSVAELSIAEIVMLMRRIPSRSEACHKGGWDKSADNAWEVRGKTLGIVGYGSIGSQLSVLAEAMGMTVLYYDVQDKLPHGNARPVASLQALLAQSDVVSLHVPQTKQTRSLIGEAEIRAMKPNSILLNNARGSVVDLAALAAALKDGHLMGAGIDVFPVEPKGNGDRFESPLQGLPNVILTPHIGGSTMEAQERIGVEVARKLVEYSDVGSTLGAVNFPAVQLPERPHGTRFMHVHHNRPGILRQVNEIFSREGCNIVAQFLQTDGEVGYVVVETDAAPDHDLDTRLLEELRTLDGTVRARLLYRRS